MHLTRRTLGAPALAAALGAALALGACGGGRPAPAVSATPAADSAAAAATAAATAANAAVDSALARMPIERRLAQYTTVRLVPDSASALSDAERRMLPLLIDAAQAMDEIFAQQAWAGRDSLLGTLGDEQVKRYVAINYGPWDRLHGNEPFVGGVGAKPKGSGFYPADMTKEEFETATSRGLNASALRSQYTVVRRESAGKLVAVPYHQAFAEPTQRAAAKLREAAALAPQASLRRYLELRAAALLNDRYQTSDLAWMEMKDNTIEVVIGPIETYEDQLFGYKAAHEAFVLVKDRGWSKRLARYAALLPSLQQGIPVPAEYKRETPGTDSDLNAYDALYYAGDANAGSKTIAINLPNDEQVQLRKGTRRLQLKNAMRAKFDRILVPVAGLLIAEDQRTYVNFDAFFENVMFHEVAHGLGIKSTINGKGTVREALKDRAGSLEEGKADILGLYMVTALATRGELSDKEVRDNYVTFLAGIFRSVRFGASSAHGRANAAALSFLAEQGAFSRDSASGTYRVDFARMPAAVDALAERILRLQGDGDYEGGGAFQEQYGVLSAQTRADLDRLSSADIPVDIVFEQGMSVLGTAEAGVQAGTETGAGR